jgi:hypothetical protein
MWGRGARGRGGGGTREEEKEQENRKRIQKMIAPLSEIGMIGGRMQGAWSIAQKGKSEIGVFFPVQAAKDLETPEE